MGPNYCGFINDALVVKNAPQSRTNLGLGTIATQSAANVTITGGTIDGVAITNGTIASAAITLGTINNTVIGGATPAAATFTTVFANTGFQVATGGYIRSGAAAGSSTLLLRAESIAAGGYVTMGTLSSGAIASLAFTQPSGSALTWDGGTIGGTTPAAGTFTTLASTGVATFGNTSSVTVNSASSGSLKLANANNQALDTWWIGFDGGSNTADSNDRARIGTVIKSGGNGQIFMTTGVLSSQVQGFFLDDSQNTTLSTGVVTAPTITTKLNVANNTTGRANITLTGTGCLSGASSEGVALTLGTSATGNRHLWIGDTALMASNNTNTVVRISGQNSNFSFIDAVTTDGSTAKTLNFQQGGGATTFGTGLFTASGTMSKPNQPCFLVHQTSDLTGLTKGADNTLTWNQEVYDQNNNFSSNTFTAPVTGRYLFNINAIAPQNFNSATRFFGKFVTSNRTYTIFNYNPTASNPSDNLPSFGSSIIVDMDAADTATIVTFCSGGTSTYDINGDQESPYWSGCLLA